VAGVLLSFHFSRSFPLLLFPSFCSYTNPLSLGPEQVFFSPWTKGIIKTNGFLYCNRCAWTLGFLPRASYFHTFIYFHLDMCHPIKIFCLRLRYGFIARRFSPILRLLEQRHFLHLLPLYLRAINFNLNI
jgi:hypothetical protein